MPQRYEEFPHWEQKQTKLFWVVSEYWNIYHQIIVNPAEIVCKPIIFRIFVFNYNVDLTKITKSL